MRKEKKKKEISNKLQIISILVGISGGLYSFAASFYKAYQNEPGGQPIRKWKSESVFKRQDQCGVCGEVIEVSLSENRDRESDLN